jgi:hypothetical protein
MGLFGNAEARAQRAADRRASRQERVAARREFLGGIVNTAAGVASQFAGAAGASEPATREEPYSGSLGSSGMPKWVLPVAAGAALLFFISKKGGRR